MFFFVYRAGEPGSASCPIHSSTSCCKENFGENLVRLVLWAADELPITQPTVASTEGNKTLCPTLTWLHPSFSHAAPDF